MAYNGVLTGTAGVVTNISDWLRAPDMLKVGNNINMLKRGVFTSRYNGWQRQRETEFNSGAEFLEFSQFVASNGSKTQIFQVGDELYSYDGLTETNIFGGGSPFTPDAEAIPCMRMFQPYAASTSPILLWMNGVDEPKKIDGTAAGDFANLQINGADYGAGGTAAPLEVKTYSKPRFCEPFRDRMIILGFDGANAMDVLITNSGTFEVVTASAPLVATDGGVFQLNPQYGSVTGCKVFKLSNSGNETIALIAQEHAVSYIRGDSALTFGLFLLTDEYGIPSNRTWIQIKSDLFFLAEDGIRSFAALSENANLVNDANTFDVQDIINRFTTGSMAKAHATHAKKYQEVQFFFPVDGNSECGAAIVMNYNTGSARGAVNPILFTRDNATVACSQYFNKHFFGGGYNGVLQDHYTVNTIDGVKCSWEIQPAFFRGDNPKELTTPTAVSVICEGDNQKCLANAFFYTRNAKTGATLKQAATPQDTVLSSPSSGTTVLGSWVLGNGAMPSEHVKYMDYYPKSVGLAHEVQLKGSEIDHVIDFLGVIYELESGGVQE